MKRLVLLRLWSVKMGLMAIFALFTSNAQAQQPYYTWRLGGGIGVMNYYGDLTYRTKTTQFNFPAYLLSIEKSLSPSFGLQLNGSYGQISGNDRTTDWKGNLVTDNPNFGRALNFKTDILSSGLLLTYHFDNGKILSQYARFAPFLFAGAGLTHFTVYGDLFNGNGNRYYYWADNTIRNQPEGTAGDIISQDGKYETKLTGLDTEKNYPNTVFSIPAGIGVKIKLADQLSASIQAGATYAFTDYLDDVSGNYATAGYDNALQAYAANPSGMIRQPRGDDKANQDWYFSTFVTLNYHFGYKQKNFKAPLIYTGYHPLETSSPKDVLTQGKPKNQSIQPQTNGESRQPSLSNIDSLRYSSVNPTSPSFADVYSPTNAKNTLPATPEKRQANPASNSNTAILYNPNYSLEIERMRADSLRSAFRQQQTEKQLAEERLKNRYPNDTYNRRLETTSDEYRRRIDTDRDANQNRSQSYIPVPIPLPAGRTNQRDTLYVKDSNASSVNQLQSDLTNLRAELNTLRSRKDTAVNQKLDSLLQLVSGLENQAIADLKAKYGADTLNPKVDTMVRLAAQSDTSLVHLLRSQVDQLNKSVEELRGKNKTNAEALKNYGKVVIYYAINKTLLTPADKQRLGIVAEKLKSDSRIKLNVEGFADRVGNPESNLILSKQRAENIVKYLAEELGVNPGQILVNYYGQAREQTSKSRNNPYQRKVELTLFMD